VVLLDRAEFPRDKTCGDGLTPRAMRVLDKMGLLADVRARGRAINAYEVLAPNGRSTTAPISGDHQALVVPRLVLDELILRQASASGATFEPGVTVERVEPTATGVDVRAHGRTFSGRLAIVATGAATGVLKRSGILCGQPTAMLAARAYYADMPRPLTSTFQLRFDGVPSPGYGWVFPTGPRSANVGVGFLPRRTKGTAIQAFERFASRVTPGGTRLGPVKGYPIRVDFLKAPTSAERTLLVGEAAGLVNPLTGEGIDYALESGQIAAEHVVQALSSGVPETWSTDYDRRLRARFERSSASANGSATGTASRRC
jgi:geranylgeranyl reductase family protein